MIRLMERGKLITLFIITALTGYSGHGENGICAYNKRVYISESSAMVPLKQ